MKRIVIVCCILAASVSIAHAQAGSSPAAPVVSKSEYFEKVKEFKKLLNNNKTGEASASFDEVNKLIIAELGVMRNKIRECKDEAEKAKLSAAASAQRTLFAQALKLKQENMQENKKEIIEKLNSFGDTIQ